jgi:hypothetical protein
MAFRLLYQSETKSLSQQCRSVLAFCHKHSIPQSIFFQQVLITRIAGQYTINKISYNRLYILLMKRFLSSFVLKVVPKWLNKRAALCINSLHFDYAVKYMRLSMQLKNYAMADICADLLKHGRIGLPKNYLEAIQIVDAGERAGNKKCGCQIRSFYRELNSDFKSRKNNSPIPRLESKSLPQQKLEDTKYFRMFRRSRHFNPHERLYDIDSKPDLLCHCIYCATDRGKYWDNQYVADCLVAAKSGYAPAQYTFGDFIVFNDKSSHYNDKALYWYLKAALQGHYEAIRGVAAILWRVGKEDIALKLFKYAKLAGAEHCDRYIELCEVEIQKKNLR